MRTYLTIQLCALLLASVAPSLLSADERALSFELALNAALANSAEAAAIEAQAARAEAERIEARRPENPELDLEVRPYVSEADQFDTEYEISLAQPIRLTDFSGRRKLGALLEHAASLEQRALLHELHQRVALAYGKAWVLQESESALAEARRSLRGLESAANSDDQPALLSLSARKLLAAEIRRLEADQLGLAGDNSRARAELTRLTSLPLAGIRLEAPALGAIPEGQLRGNPLALPAAERLNLLTELARSQDAVARLDSFPKLTPRVGFEHTSDGDDRLTVGLSVPLPLFNRNSAARLKSGADLRAAEKRQRYLHGEGFAEEIAQLAAAASRSSEQARIYRETIVPALREAVGAAQHELESGQGALLQVWQIVSQLNETSERALELYSKSLAERVELSILTGVIF